MKIALFYLALASALFTVSLIISIWKHRKQASVSRLIGWVLCGGIITVIAIVVGMFTAIIAGSKNTVMQAKKIILQL